MSFVARCVGEHGGMQLLGRQVFVTKVLGNVAEPIRHHSRPISWAEYLSLLDSDRKISAAALMVICELKLKRTNADLATG
jgi:hypothetical protein